MVTAYRCIDVDGTRIFYREAGAAGAPKLLLLHGFPTSSHMIERFTEIMGFERYARGPTCHQKLRPGLFKFDKDRRCPWAVADYQPWGRFMSGSDAPLSLHPCSAIVSNASAGLHGCKGTNATNSRSLNIEPQLEGGPAVDIGERE